MHKPIALIIALAGCDGCGNGSHNDAAVIDIDNASCGDQVHFTGEYVDWDTDRSFCGIADAVVEVAGGGGMDSTAPNGRFDLCIPNQATTKLTVMQPGAPSQCSNPISTYAVSTMLFANREVILAGGFFSGRAFTVARQDTFYQGAGLTFDAAKAQLFVHVNGTPKPVAIAATHGATQAVSTTTWAAGDTGHDVFFPNVDIGTGTTTITVTGGSVTGGANVPLLAGTITNVSIIVH